MTHADLDPADAQKALAADADLIVLDVRTEPEYRQHRIDGAKLIPVQELHMRHSELEPAASYLVVCEHGMRSVAACEMLSSVGFGNLTNMVGGMARWVGEGLPHTGG